MAWIITNPDGFTNLGDGGFEPPASLGTDAIANVSPGGVFAIVTSEFHSGTHALQYRPSTSPAYSPGSPTTRYSLFRVKPGIAFIAGRRYSISGWLKVSGKDAVVAAAKPVGITINLGAGANGDAYSFTGAITIMANIHTQFGVWVQFNTQFIAPTTRTIDKSWFTFSLFWTESQYPGSGQPFKNLILNFDDAALTEESDTPPDPITINSTQSNVTVNGGSDGYITIDSITGGVGPFTYLWSDGITTEDRPALPAGSYTVTVTDSLGATKQKSFTITEPDLMTASEVHTNATAAGVCDGTISVSVEGGIGPYSYLWDDGPSSGPNRSGLCDGPYSVTITDALGSVVTLNVTITEPEAEPTKKNSFLYISSQNSLRYVSPVTPNGCTVFQTFDNTLLCNEEHPYFTKSNYFQKVAQCDVFPTQWQSDYEGHEIQLIDYQSDVVIKTFSPELKQQLMGLQEMFGIYMTNHGSGQSRVFFNSGAIPIPLSPGDVFTIINNGDGFNGTYTIVSIQNDLLVGSQYLVINKNYVLTDPSTSADGVFTSNVVEFDVYEAIHAFGDVPIGMYYMRIAGIGGDTPNEWFSEPIFLDTEHPDTNLIEYRSFDNAWDLIWTTGITCRVRVESWFQERYIKGKRTVSRNCNGRLVKVMAQKYRKGKLQFIQIPPYLYEKLSVAMDCDLIRVNMEEVQTDEDLADPKYIPRYQMVNTDIMVEFVNWFQTYNSDDIGDVDSEGGFIIANNGFLRR